ncbi:MAG: AAA family ATPase [Oscillospiraceae bacterium]|jgi:septum site-determining protein MinD|nr:AAA family ATPase [Oscillospiraceae bacterium]
MGRIIAVISGKGGTGKTTAVGAIGSCLGALGKRTLCVDCDADLQNLDIVMGAVNYVLPAVPDASALPDDITDLCLEHPNLENVWLLPPLSFSDDVRAASYAPLFSAVRDQFDFCLLDAPAGIGDDVKRLLGYADEAIIVSTGDRPSLRDGQTMCSLLRESGMTDVRLLVNRVDPRAFRRERATVDDVIDAVGARLLGIVRDDRTVSEAANRETPLVLYSRKAASQGFLRVARRITGESIPVPGA